MFFCYSVLKKRYSVILSLKKVVMSKEPKYEEAYTELQTIVRKMENDELDIDQLSEQLKRAQELIKLCKDKLTKTDEEIKKILAEK